MVMSEQLLAARAVVGQPGESRRERLHGMLVVADVGANVLAQRRHRLLQASSRIADLLGRRELAVHRREHENRDSRGEHERMKRVAAKTARRPLVGVDESPGGRATGQEIGDRHCHETAHHQLQRDGEDRVAQIVDAVQPRYRDERRGHCRPDDQAAEHRGAAAPREEADDDRLQRQKAKSDREDPASGYRVDERGQRAIPGTEQDRHRQRDDAPEQQRCG